MIDFKPLEQDEVKAIHIVEQQGITFDDLRAEVNRQYDTVAEILNQATDADIIFEPHDPDADDRFADSEDERYIGWTLGHQVAHITASNEEGAAFASLLARGIPMGGRIRVETPWEQVDTVEKAQQRLEESRRIILAYLSAIPDEPDLETLREIGSERAQAFFGPLNAPASMVSSLSHHVGHMEQLQRTLDEAQSAAANA
jgi:hypothetical protein